MVGGKRTEACSLPNISGPFQMKKPILSENLPNLAKNSKSLQTVVSKPWFEICDEAEVKLRLKKR